MVHQPTRAASGTARMLSISNRVPPTAICLSRPNWTNCFRARDLIAATHDVDQHLWVERLGLDQVGRIIRRSDRHQRAGRGPARGLQQLLEAGLNRMAIGVVRRQEVPFLAELLDQCGSDRIAIHRGRIADTEDVPRTARSGDRVGMTAGDNVENFLFAGHLRHRNRDTGVDVADDEADLVALDQLACLLYAGTDVIGGVFDQELDWPAEDAALLVDFLCSEFGAYDFAPGNSSIGARDRIDHADADRRLTAGLDDVWGRKLHRSNCRAGFEDRPSIDQPSIAQPGPLRGSHAVLPDNVMCRGVAFFDAFGSA